MSRTLPSRLASRFAPPEPDLVDTVTMSPSLRTLARMGQLRPLRRGAEIISEGDIGDTLFIVLRGRLRAYSMAPSGREITYGIYGAGDYVGEMGLDGGPRSANVQAIEPTVCMAITRATLERHLAAEPKFAFELLAKAIWRARCATSSLREIALNDVYGRLKLLLERIAVAQDDGTWLIDPAPSQLEMSQEVGCGREMVNRIVKDLERGGYVQRARRWLRIVRRLPPRW